MNEGTSFKDLQILSLFEWDMKETKLNRNLWLYIEFMLTIHNQQFEAQTINLFLLQYYGLEVKF
jgi:hypothetical protein